MILYKTGCLSAVDLFQKNLINKILSNNRSLIAGGVISEQPDQHDVMLV